MFSPFVIALALNTFFGSAPCEVEYSLFEDHAWYVLDDSGVVVPVETLDQCPVPLMAQGCLVDK